MTRLPIVGGDDGAWGTVLNDYLTETGLNSALAEDVLVGATSFDLANPSAGLRVGSIIAIDAFTTECEIRTVSAVSGNTITVAATKFAHGSGDRVVPINDTVVPISLYGIKGDGTDEWAPLQRLVREAGGLNLRVRGSWSTKISIQQPLIFETGTRAYELFIASRAGFTPVDAGGAMCILANGGSPRSQPFTATASDNLFTVASGPGHGAGNTIVFNAPYGETLPGGLVAGRIYYIKTTPTGTTFTLSETSGGAELDITSDGAGYCYPRISSLSRIYWDNIYLELNVADLNGLQTFLQQPSYSNNLRIEMNSDATTLNTGLVPTLGVGWILNGQLSCHMNVQIGTAANCIGAHIQGVGHLVRGFNDNGVNNNDVGIKIVGQWNHIEDLWIETVGKAGVWFPAGTNQRANVIDGALYMGGGEAFVLCDDAAATFEIGTGYAPTTQIVLAGAGVPTVQNMGITNQTFLGLWKRANAGPTFKGRGAAHISGDYTIADYSVELWRQNAVGTITLPPITGWTGFSTTIYNNSSGSVTLDPTGAELIGGAATYTLGPGESIKIYNTGASYEIVSKSVPPGALQTYTESNVTTDRSFDANATTIDEVADVLGTLISDLQERKIIG